MSNDQKPDPPAGVADAVALHAGPRQRVVCPTCQHDITPSVRALVSPRRTNRAQALIIPINCPECNAIIVRITPGPQIHLPGN